MVANIRGSGTEAANTPADEIAVKVDATFEQLLWLSGATRGFLLEGVSGSETEERIVAASGLARDHITGYCECARAIRLRLQAPALETAANGEVRCWQFGLPAGDPAEDIVGGWLRAQGLGSGLYLQHRSTTGLRIQVHLFRGPNDGPFTTKELALSSRMLPIVTDMVELAGYANQLTRLSELAQTALDGIPYGVLLLTNDGDLLGANTAGVDILSESDGLSVGMNGLIASSHADTTRLHEFLALAGDSSLDFPRYLSLPRPSGRIDMQLSLVPVRNKRDEISENADRIVIIGEPDDPRGLEIRALVTLLGLTNAEARLLAGLAQGRSLQEQCSMMGIKISTARTYLARMLSKTGTRRQPELIGLALRSLAKLPSQ